VPIPTLPDGLITKLVAVEDPTTNWFASPATGFTANLAHGVDDPTPTNLFEFIYKLPFPRFMFEPNKFVVEAVVLNRIVVVAFVVVDRSKNDPPVTSNNEFGVEVADAPITTPSAEFG